MKYTKPKKAPGAIFNTWIIDIDKGSIMDEKSLRQTQITARFTSDETGETISLASERDEIQLSVNFKKIEELIEAARKERERNRN